MLHVCDLKRVQIRNHPVWGCDLNLVTAIRLKFLEILDMAISNDLQFAIFGALTEFWEAWTIPCLVDGNNLLIKAQHLGHQGYSSLESCRRTTVMLQQLLGSDPWRCGGLDYMDLIQQKVGRALRNAGRQNTERKKGQQMPIWLRQGSQKYPPPIFDWFDSLKMHWSHPFQKSRRMILTNIFPSHFAPDN